MSSTILDVLTIANCLSVAVSYGRLSLPIEFARILPFKIPHFRAIGEYLVWSRTKLRHRFSRHHALGNLAAYINLCTA